MLNFETTLSKFITALGIFHIGEETARLFAEQIIAKLKNKISKIKNNELLDILNNLTVEKLQKTKYDKAKKLGVKIINEKEFLELFQDEISK